MFVPTCATCHMSGLNGLKVTHDPSERLSYLLAAEISDEAARLRAGPGDDEGDLRAVPHAAARRARLRRGREGGREHQREGARRRRRSTRASAQDKVVTGPPFSHPIDFLYFDLWHYYGRTAKHGAFMGGQDFAQWHGNYPMLQHTVELKAQAEELRRAHAKPK